MARPVSSPLVLWSVVVLALLAGHDATHAFDSGLKTSLGALAVVAVPQWLLLAFVLGVVVRGERVRSSAAALLLGAGVVLGFVAVHLLPFSPTSYWDLHPSALSWALVWAPVPAGVVLTTLAWQEWRAALRPGRSSACRLSS